MISVLRVPSGLVDSADSEVRPRCIAEVAMAALSFFRPQPEETFSFHRARSSHLNFSPQPTQQRLLAGFFSFPTFARYFRRTNLSFRFTFCPLCFVFQRRLLHNLILLIWTNLLLETTSFWPLFDHILCAHGHFFSSLFFSFLRYFCFFSKLRFFRAIFVWSRQSRKKYHKILNHSCTHTNLLCFYFQK